MPAQGDYPIPKFHFLVDWGDGFRAGFTEVSGLDFETEMIEYREGVANKGLQKIPGLIKHGNVTLKRGTFAGDGDLFKLWKETSSFQDGNQTGHQIRRTVIIKLLNEKHEPIVTWMLSNAWVTKLQSTDLKADANEVAIETMELAHEGLTIVGA